MSGHWTNDRRLDLARDHSRRMSRIDSAVGPTGMLGVQLLASVRCDGGVGAGEVSYRRYEVGSYEALWGALCRHTLRVQVDGDDPTPAFDDVVAELLDQADAQTGHLDDCAATLTWPSLDVACAAPLVRHGFAPLTVLVVHELGESGQSAPSVAIRRARHGDVDSLTEQACLLHRFEAQLGALPQRPDLRDRVRGELRDSLESDVDFVLVAVVDGAMAGFIQGQVPHGAWIERQVSIGPVGYLSRLFVQPAARRLSVGRSLVSAAHAMLRGSGAAHALLHHSMHNPLAAPMWARLGYRPVLTTWTKKLGQRL
jgi:ribosomal protein S18 acetylase RimI-like enzyme